MLRIVMDVDRPVGQAMASRRRWPWIWSAMGTCGWYLWRRSPVEQEVITNEMSL